MPVFPGMRTAMSFWGLERGGRPKELQIAVLEDHFVDHVNQLPWSLTMEFGNLWIFNAVTWLKIAIHRISGAESRKYCGNLEIEHWGSRVRITFVLTSDCSPCAV